MCEFLISNTYYNDDNCSRCYMTYSHFKNVFEWYTIRSQIWSRDIRVDSCHSHSFFLISNRNMPYGFGLRLLVTLLKSVPTRITQKDMYNSANFTRFQKRFIR